MIYAIEIETKKVDGIKKKLVDTYSSNQAIVGEVIKNFNIYRGHIYSWKIDEVKFEDGKSNLLIDIEKGNYQKKVPLEKRLLRQKFISFDEFDLK